MRASSLVVLSGVSGAGKSTALHALEDVGFVCVDNLPGPLVDAYVSFLLKLPEEWLAQSASGSEKNFAILVDCRDATSVRTVVSSIDRLKTAGVPVQLYFFDCRDDVVVRRFQETRRPHPYLTDRTGSGIRDALERERQVLAELRDAAERIIDTSAMTPHELRQSMHGIIGRSVPMETTIVSFGFKYGPPKDADLLVDVRFLPNPQFVPELREFTGLEPAVSHYVLNNEDTGRFLSHYVPLLQFLLPRYAREGKRYLTVGIGCTGGKHRSVAISEEIVRQLAESGIIASARHRDARRGI